MEVKREHLQRLKAEADNLRRNVKVDEPIARRRFKQLEWKLQTNPWRASEEKGTIAEVAELERQLAVHEALNEKKAITTQLRSEVEAAYLQINKTREELAAEAKRSQEAHEQMIEAYSKIRDLHQVAGERHKSFLEAKGKAEEALKRLGQLLSEKNLLERQLTVDREVEESARLMEHQRLMSQAAEDKLKRGKKLTIHEFKLLLEQGKV